MRSKIIWKNSIIVCLTCICWFPSHDLGGIFNFDGATDYLQVASNGSTTGFNVTTHTDRDWETLDAPNVPIGTVPTVEPAEVPDPI